ncbi:GNAT family N-acetyltransferase [Sphingomonas oryzagri]|uniref:GNAT family N-acetyltransferase n=1 Tax=Sphingomonas oryzagri TaxID=3042314 RepID=A0ABT6MW53_9SPHN|nr:GNAT family N-acetyltransferase [Sphingomonas oryzagri]MDH7637171.1 GNAT family N-acetyltransferase [Sphingomonas oryzagri]
MNAHPLDRPAWSALTGGWAHLAHGDDRAWRIEPDHGPFAATADFTPENIDALRSLPGAEGELWLVETAPLPALPGLTVLREADITQMVAGTISSGEPDFEVEELGEADAAEMLALATLTRPGPFLVKTHRLGRFIGVKQSGCLVAMAGERMRMPGFAEVSGVCTHPDHRGKGYAAGLMRLVARRMLAQGEMPFLHAYAANEGAVRLYDTLGFRIRRTVRLTVVTTRA